MTFFAQAHAIDADWRRALAAAGARLDAQWEARGGRDGMPTVGFAYFTDHHAGHAASLLEGLRSRWPGVCWAGCVAVGVISGAEELVDVPALSLMIGALPPAQVAPFSGARPPQADRAWTALVHADPSTPDIAELIGEMSERTGSRYLFGGLAASRHGHLHLADGVFSGGLSGIAFGPEVGLVSRVTQGSQPIGPVHTVTACEHHIVRTLDGDAALPALLRDLGVEGIDPRQALPLLRATLVGLSDASDAMLARGGQFGPDVRVRHLVGLDPGRQAFAVADVVEPGMKLGFCRRDVEAARRDLVRICTEIREEVETESLAGSVTARDGSAAAAAAAAAASTDRRIAAAIYISCAGRGGGHFGAPSAEARIVRRALGDVPTVGFFAGGEIAHRHLYGYTGVLTVFTAPR